jgi:Fic-DOC domain mobile mystery protein B
MIFEYLPGQTPIDAAEEEALLLPLKTQKQLNEAEEANIIDARTWALSDRILGGIDPLTEEFVFDLHRRMFGEVWDWAGEPRTRDKNISVPFFKIRVELRQLLDDAKYWREHNVYEPDELALRFHHRLVTIHVFPNGNGRHARLMADILAHTMRRPAFTWGGGADLISGKDARTSYLEALKAADGGDYGPLVKFARE